MAANYISLALTFLAAGFSIRCLRSKFATGSKGNGAALKSLFALDICLMLFSLLYALHTGELACVPYNSARCVRIKAVHVF